MIKCNMNIWGRDFELPVIIKQFKGIDITDIQKQAVEKIDDCNIAINQSKDKVEKYILDNGLKDNGITDVTNIFKYVIPKSIFIPKFNDRVVAFMCNYKYDMEHGIAIVIENEKFKEIGQQDLIL